MPAAETDAIRESRRKARDELFKDRSRYDSSPGAALCAVFSKSALYDADGDDDTGVMPGDRPLIYPIMVFVRAA